MLHGALQDGEPRRILVLPGEVSAETGRRMRRLGIEIVRYDWQGSQPIFTNLKKALS